MEYFTKLNSLLDAGWKMTDSSCEDCKSANVYHPQTAVMKCVKCEKESKVDIITEDEAKESNIIPKNDSNEKNSFEICGKPTTKFEDDNYWGPTSKENTKTNDVSKKLASKLLKGWKMMEECCPDCFVPLMQSKQGKNICVECESDFPVLKEQSQNSPKNTQPYPQPQLQISNQTQRKPSIPKKETPSKSHHQSNPTLQNDHSLESSLHSSLSSISSFYMRFLAKADSLNDRESIEEGLSAISKVITLKNQI